jgi:hypothetical protein
MKEDRTVTTAREIRFVIVADDHEAARNLYRDVFGLEVGG